MITPEQLRAARGLLDWSRGDLSKASGISQETIKNIEHNVFHPQETTEKAIVKAFAAQDVRFLGSDGVQKKTEPVTLYKGEEELRMFLDCLYEAAKAGGDICVFDDKALARHLGDYAEMHHRRLNQLNGIKIRSLVRESGDEPPPVSPYGECRSIPSDKFCAVPFYLFGTRLAFILCENERASVTSFSVPSVMEAYRKQFDALWNKASPLAKKPLPKEKEENPVA